MLVKKKQPRLYMALKSCGDCGSKGQRSKVKGSLFLVLLCWTRNGKGDDRRFKSLHLATALV
jgi:hypothetical protein